MTRRCECCGREFASDNPRKRFCSDTCAARLRKRKERAAKAAVAPPDDALLSKLEHCCWQAAHDARTEDDKWLALAAAIVAAGDPEAALRWFAASDPTAARALGLVFGEAA